MTWFLAWVFIVPPVLLLWYWLCYRFAITASSPFFLVPFHIPSMLFLLLKLFPACSLSFCAFLISLVTTCCILISEELMLGSTDEEDHVAFVFLDLGHFLQYHSFVDLSVCLLFSFIFAAEYYHDCVCISYFHYPSLIWKTFRLFPFFSSC